MEPLHGLLRRQLKRHIGDFSAAPEKWRALVEAVDDLPEKTRHAFQLHKLEGLSHAETARRMGISTSTVEKHISSALKTLTRRLR